MTEPLPREIVCRSCGAPIFFATSAKGKSVPMDAIPVPPHGLFLVRDGKLEMPPLLYQSHFASCPNAAQHRKAEAS